MMRTVPIGVVAALAAAAGAVAGCGGDSSSGGASGKPYTVTIGSLQAFTGDLGVNGEPTDKAVKLAAGKLNAAAKQAGAHVSFKVQSADTQSDPQAAISAARKLVSSGADCIVGPFTTPVTTTVLNSVTKVRHVPMLPSAGGDAVSTLDDDGTVFRTVPPDHLQARAVVEGVERMLGTAKGKTVSFAYQNAPYGEDFARVFVPAWKALGGRVQGPIAYDPDQGSYDSEAAKIVAGNPDAYVIIDYPETYGKVGAALLRTGSFDASKLFVPTTLALPTIPSTIPTRALDGAHGEEVGTPDTPQTKAFDTLYASAAGPKSGSLIANAFDAAILCGLAGVGAGSDDPEEIAGQLPRVGGATGAKLSYLQLDKAIRDLRARRPIQYQGVSGPIRFDPHGDPVAQLFAYYTFKHGKLVVQSRRDVTATADAGA